MSLRPQNGGAKKMQIRRRAKLPRRRERDARKQRRGEAGIERSRRIIYRDFSMLLNKTSVSRFLYWLLSLSSLSRVLPGFDGLIGGASQPVPLSLHPHRIARSSA